jgi:hypothetical protein
MCFSDRIRPCTIYLKLGLKFDSFYLCFYLCFSARESTKTEIKCDFCQQWAYNNEIFGFLSLYFVQLLIKLQINLEAVFIQRLCTTIVQPMGCCVHNINKAPFTRPNFLCQISFVTY